MCLFPRDERTLLPWLSPAATLYSMLDRGRAFQGGMLDAMGFGPSGTPSRTVLCGPFFTLESYGECGRGSPAVLAVPAPIKRAYIWDISPENSAVRRLLESGIRVYVIWWKGPEAGDRHLGLADYAGRSILSCLDAVRSDHGGGRPFLAGHSLGGTFAAVFASLHPEKVRGLVLLGAPIRFGPDVGDIDSLVARSPNARVIASLLGNVPGSFLSVMSTLASPSSFQGERWTDWLESMRDPQSVQTHLRVVRWTLDELPMPGLLFEGIVEQLYRENRFMEGTLVIDGVPALPRNVRAPILSVTDRLSTVVPPEASLPFHDAARSRDAESLWYERDVGVALQHVGMLVGRRSHRNLWPEIVRWIHGRSTV